MARKPRSTTPKQTSSNKLLEALQFLSLITTAKGAPNETHITLCNGAAVAYNSVMGIGCYIDETLTACPHNSTLIEALSKCGQNLSITQLDGNRLSIKSDKFKAIVPGLEPYSIQSTFPDPAQAEVTEELRAAMKVAASLTEENGQFIYNVSILMNGQSIISTFGGKIIIEYWHGLNLPTNLPLPKSFANILAKITKPIKSFGMSQSSVTVYFSDDSWVKTHLYAEPWPEIAGILEGPSNPYPLLPDFYKAIETIAHFSSDGLLYCDDNVICSHRTKDQGASYEIEGIPRGPILNIKQFMLIKPWIQTIDFFAHGQNGIPMIKFFGKNLRGAIAGRTK